MNEPCPACGSTRYTRTEDGTFYCEAGHEALVGHLHRAVAVAVRFSTAHRFAKLCLLASSTRQFLEQVAEYNPSYNTTRYGSQATRGGSQPRPAGSQATRVDSSDDDGGSTDPKLYQTLEAFQLILIIQIEYLIASQGYSPLTEACTGSVDDAARSDCALGIAINTNEESLHSSNACVSCGSSTWILRRNIITA
jgi:hypothetical protein